MATETIIRRITNFITIVNCPKMVNVIITWFCWHLQAILEILFTTLSYLLVIVYIFRLRVNAIIKRSNVIRIRIHLIMQM